MIDRADSRFIGRAGLHYWPEFDETEVGWVLRRDAWGHGYAKEAARACVEWGFASLPISYLTAIIHPGNERSIRVARRLGLSPLRTDVLLGIPASAAASPLTAAHASPPPTLIRRAPASTISSSDIPGRASTLTGFATAVPPRRSPRRCSVRVRRAHRRRRA